MLLAVSINSAARPRGNDMLPLVIAGKAARMHSVHNLPDRALTVSLHQVFVHPWYHQLPISYRLISCYGH